MTGQEARDQRSDMSNTTVTVWKCANCGMPWQVKGEDPNAEKYAKCSICGNDEWDAYEEAARRTLTIDLDTGEWVSGGPLTEGDGYRVASSVLPGMPEDRIEQAYGEWMRDDPAPRDIPGFEGTRGALAGLSIFGADEGGENRG